MGGLSTPDVIKSALDKNEVVVGQKITIPERYNPEAETEEVSHEERQVRLKKVDSIRKMLADQSAPSTSTSENPDEDKKEREHLLALNQMIAQQVLQKRRSFSGSK